MDEQSLQLDELKVRNYEMYKYFKKGLDIVSVLKSKTYEAYIVGGAVRDFILNIDFNDVDIATNATPDAIKDIFPDYEIDDTFANLGSIILKDAGFRYEITTFRNEEYVKSKIKEVHYSKKLVEDIIRRDFTINALALTPNLTIIDIVDGKKDLEKGIVRVIGSGKRRFKDDPSRILRGLLLVAKFNFSLDSLTEKAMRKSKAYLKELSEQKILSYMYKILNEKHGLKALHIIDNNNLFKFIPSFSYWVSLLIKPYKKLSVLEKLALLYRVTGNVIPNNLLTKEEAYITKNLYNLSLTLSGAKVDAMMVLQTGVEQLLSADKIAKAYNHRYKKQTTKIKKIYRKLPIKTVDQLDFTMRELLDVLKGNERLASSTMNELLTLVVNKEIANRNDKIRETAYKLLNHTYYPVETRNKIKPASDKRKIFHHNKRKDEKYFDDSYEETRLAEKVYDDPSSYFDAWDQIPTDDYYDNIDSYIINVPSNDMIQDLLNDYTDDFTQLYKIYLKGVPGYDRLNIREQALKQEEVKQQVKSFLLKNNPKYRALEEKGVI